MNWWVALAVCLGAVVAATGTALAARNPRGDKLTRTVLNAAGVAVWPDSAAPAAPADLVAAAARVAKRTVTREGYAAARMAASEGGKDTAFERRQRIWVLRNDWRELRAGNPARFPTMESVLTFSKVEAERGFFGNQTGRRYATSIDPTLGDLLDAETILRESGDPTRGAVKFVDADGLGVQAGTEGKTIASLEAAWKLSAERLPGTTRDLYVFR